MSYNDTYKRHLEPDYLYYNLDVANNNVIDNGNKVELKYTDVRDKPIIEDTSKYYMSIDRVQLDGLKLPLFIPRIETGQSDINKTVYKLSIRYEYKYNNGSQNNITNTKNITFFTRNLKSNLPPSPTEEQNISEYYHVNTYEHFSEMFNNTLKSINSDLQSLIRIDTGDNNITVPLHPVLHYNTSSEKFELYLDKKTYGKTGEDFEDTSGNNIDFHSRLFFDSNTYSLLDGFNNSYTGGDKSSINSINIDYLTYEIFPNKDPLDLNVVTLKGNEYYKLLPNYDNLSNIWSPITSIVFISNIDIVPELTGEGNNYLKNGSNIGSNLTTFRKIITDIQLPGEAQQYKKKISYFSPSAGYRWSELTKTKNTIREIDFQVFYKLKSNGKLYPVETLNGSNINILIKFKHKNV